jgi:hypothetical protein
MELREFVRSTLLEIISGVSDAQKALAEEGSTAVVNALASRQDIKRYSQRGTRLLEMVEFDVALTVTETTDKGIGGRLSIAAASIGSQRGTSIENSEVSRVRFQVPVVLPMGKGTQEDDGTAALA